MLLNPTRADHIQLWHATRDTARRPYPYMVRLITMWRRYSTGTGHSLIRSHPYVTQCCYPILLALIGHILACRIPMHSYVTQCCCTPPATGTGHSLISHVASLCDAVAATPEPTPLLRPYMACRGHHSMTQCCCTLPALRATYTIHLLATLRPGDEVTVGDSITPACTATGLDDCQPPPVHVSAEGTLWQWN